MHWSACRRRETYLLVVNSILILLRKLWEELIEDAEQNNGREGI